jgi:ABC-type transport system involved in multi-copper enzyme maturation permease subunit
MSMTTTSAPVSLASRTASAPVSGLAGYVDIGGPLDQPAQSGPDERLVVGEDDLDGHRAEAGAGTGPNQMAPGLQPWSKAGIIMKENTSQGSAYAAMIVTASHGVRMQWDYVNDTPGLADSVSASEPRWLRLVRVGETITGSDSADGTHWTLLGTAALPGLTSTVQAGLFAAGTGSENPTVATGVFRDIGLSWPATRWTGTNVGGVNGPNDPNGVALPGTLRQSAGTITVTSYGDISPQLSPLGAWSIQRALDGTAIGLIPLIVVGAMFVTAEYRRGLIRVSLAASPRRGRLLAAKAVVIGAVSFVTGLIAATLAVAIGAHTLARTSQPLWPVPALTLARMVTGAAALLAVAAVLALAIGTIQRRSATTVATAIVVIFVPYLLAIVPPLQPGPAGLTGGGLGLGVREWLLRITPAAGFSVQQAVPRFSQVTGVSYTPNWGYYPLAPWAGFAVECAWAVAGVLAIGDEYSTGMIKLSLTAMPRRLTWLFAKAAVLTGPVLIASALAVAGSALAGWLILPGHGFTPAHGYASLTAGADIRAAAGAVLYLTLIALLSLGVTAAVRDSAAAIGLVLGLLYLFPIVASLVSDATLARRLQQIGPLSAGLDAQATIGVKSLPLTPWQGLGVVALWTVGALLLGALVLRSRDA